MDPSNGNNTAGCCDLEVAAAFRLTHQATSGGASAHAPPTSSLQASQSETAYQPHMPGVARASVCRSVSLSWLAYWRRISTLREAALSGTTIWAAIGMLLARGSRQCELTPARHSHRDAERLNSPGLLVWQAKRDAGGEAGAQRGVQVGLAVGGADEDCEVVVHAGR